MSRSAAPRALTGHTRVVGVIGYPVEHSLSPAMHNAEFERLGLDWVYVPFPVRPENVEAALRGLAALGVAGTNVTIPHKQAVLPVLDEVTPEARIIGAVNTIHIDENGRMTGHNTDAPGWVEDIQQDILLAGSTVAILGAGGASRALCVAAALAGAKNVCIFNRTTETARLMSESLQAEFTQTVFDWAPLDGGGSRDKFLNYEIVVNATSVGMTTNPGSPVPVDWLNENQYVYDTIYTPAETELLRAARQRGCATRNGTGMLARQGALAFEIWTGQKADPERMESVIRRHLAGERGAL